jgi:hypothetical protein
MTLETFRDDSMKITCPNCKCSGDAPDEMLGKPVQCSGCNRVFEVPPVNPSQQETGIQVPQQRVETGIQLPRPAKQIKEESQFSKVSEARAKRLVGIFTAVFGVCSVMCCMTSWTFVFAFDAGVPNPATLTLVYSGWAFPFVCWLSILAAFGLMRLHRHTASVAVFGLPVLNILVIAFAMVWLQWAYGGSFRSREMLDRFEQNHQKFEATTATPPMTGYIHFEKTTQMVKRGEEVTFTAVKGKIGDVVGIEKIVKGGGTTYSALPSTLSKFGVSGSYTQQSVTCKADVNAVVGLYLIIIRDAKLVEGKGYVYGQKEDIILRVEVTN